MSYLIEEPIKEGFFQCHRLVHWELYRSGWYSCWCDYAGCFLKSDSLKGLKKSYREYREKEIEIMGR